MSQKDHPLKFLRLRTKIYFLLSTPCGHDSYMYQADLIISLLLERLLCLPKSGLKNNAYCDYISILIHNCNDYALTYRLYYSCRQDFTDGSSKWQMAPHDCFLSAKMNMEHGARLSPCRELSGHAK